MFDCNCKSASCNLHEAATARGCSPCPILYPCGMANTALPTPHLLRRLLSVQPIAARHPIRCCQLYPRPKTPSKLYPVKIYGQRSTPQPSPLSRKSNQDPENPSSSSYVFRSSLPTQTSLSQFSRCSCHYNSLFISEKSLKPAEAIPKFPRASLKTLKEG